MASPRTAVNSILIADHDLANWPEKPSYHKCTGHSELGLTCNLADQRLANIRIYRESSGVTLIIRFNSIVLPYPGKKLLFACDELSMAQFELTNEICQ